MIEPGELGSIPEPDTLWVIDTLDHLTDIESSLGSVLSVVDLIVTENLTVNRGHGRQRFHSRRPFPAIATLFARHGLIPSSTKAGAPIMFWTRYC
ncbi:MAG: hypothetical protein GEU83_11180 [Pseudonocardiaceae bacterium]|nr:hypothetical protein [Pseudonocardiaceae bacterium]